MTTEVESKESEREAEMALVCDVNLAGNLCRALGSKFRIKIMEVLKRYGPEMTLDALVKKCAEEGYYMQVSSAQFHLRKMQQYAQMVEMTKEPSSTTVRLLRYVQIGLDELKRTG